MRNAKQVILDVAKDFEKMTGRKYGLFEEYKLEDAEIAIVCMNSTAGTTKEVVDSLREKGIKAGGNVVMPNLSPTNVREKYALYDGKICTGDEAAECRKCIERRINNAGFEIAVTRGDNVKWSQENPHVPQYDDKIVDINGILGF